jgi:MFS family permease
LHNTDPTSGLLILSSHIMTVHETRETLDVEHGRRHFGAKMVFTVVFICFGTASFGFSNAVIGSTLGQPSFLSAMGLDTAPNAEALVSALLAVYFIGGLFGGTCHSLLADRYGRKVSASVAAAIMIVGSAVCTAANSIGLYIAFRFFCGWA